MPEAPLLVTVRQAQPELGGIGRDALYALIRDGRIRVVRVGRKMLIPRAELQAFVERELERTAGDTRPA